MAANTFLRHAGLWRQVNEFWIRNGSAWRKCAAVWRFDASTGTWRMMHFELQAPILWFVGGSGSDVMIYVTNAAATSFGQQMRLQGTYTVDQGFGPSSSPVDVLLSQFDDSSFVFPSPWNYGQGTFEQYNVTMRFVKGGRNGPTSPLILTK